MSCTLGSLAREIGVTLDAAVAARRVTGVTEDSRAVAPGALFVAIRGDRCDGARFLPEAIARGACAVVLERGTDRSGAGSAVPVLEVEDARAALASLAASFHGHPTRVLDTIGVTGTDGKTTTCHLLAHLLGASRCRLVGTVTNVLSGVSPLTTPPAPVVQRIAAEARDAGRSALILEASSAGLAQHRLDAVAFDAAVFTNFSDEHLRLHGSREAYLEAKLRLFRGLAANAAAYINGDDPVADRVADACGCRIVRFGQAAGSDVRATQLTTTPDGVAFHLTGGGREEATAVPLLGTHQVSNALAAAAVALDRGIDGRRIVERLREAPPVPGRGERFRTVRGALAVVDFAHTPRALEAMLTALAATASPVIAVYGCSGDGGREKDRAMGRAAGRIAERSLITTDNPKHEDPAAIAAAIAASVDEVGGHQEIILDREAAIRRAVALAGPGAAILIAGKGHETVQQIGDQAVPYSDSRVLVEDGLAVPLDRGALRC
jgi:UDP-N-acetylmuramyl-tripeptide synthetase